MRRFASIVAIFLLLAAAALLGMLNSCSPNVTVVNIDNGFGAAYTAVLIARAASSRS